MTDTRDLLSQPDEDGEPTTPPAPDVADVDDASRPAAATDDTSPPAASDADAEAPRRPAGRLRIPEETKGRYVVLFARKPSRGDDARPSYTEVDCVEANGPDHAKRVVMGDTAADAPFADFLRHSAAQKPGILLRAVPAMHWPGDVKPTTFDRPDPVLSIG